MGEREETKDDAGRSVSDEGGPGDVEAAGETTAVAAISGPAESKPVGADTMVKVADTPGPQESP